MNPPKIAKKILFVHKIKFQFGYGNITLDCPPCECNTNGSSDTFCDTETGQCPCKMGIEGLKCDECMDGYFGLSIDGCEGEYRSFFLLHSLIFSGRTLNDCNIRSTRNNKPMNS